MKVLKNLGLTDNEITIYLDVLTYGESTAYDIGKRTGIYRVHVYDKLEQLMKKSLISQVYKGVKRCFSAANPSLILQIVDQQRADLEEKEKEVKDTVIELSRLMHRSKENTIVEVFKGVEGLKYVLKDILKIKKEVLITGIDDAKYEEALPIFMQQYFRDLRKFGIQERVITVKKKGVFQFPKEIAPTTQYRFLEEQNFNPTNTFIYGHSVVIVTWGTPVTCVMINNKNLADTYRIHFEQLWKIASTRGLK